MSKLDGEYFIKLFVRECRAKLKELSDALLELEQVTTDHSSTPSLIDTLFRCVHTVKGNATTTFHSVSLEELDGAASHIECISEVAHSLETLMGAIRDHTVELTTERIDLMFEAESALSAFLNAIQQGTPVQLDVDHLLTRLQRLADGTPTEEVNSEQSYSAFDITLQYDEPLLKYATLSMFYSDVKLEYADCLFSPTIEELMSGAPIEQVVVSLPAHHDKKEILSYLSSIENVVHVSLLVEKESSRMDTDPPVAIQSDIGGPSSSTSNEPTHPLSTAYEVEDIRVPIIRIDEVFHHVSNLVILKNKLLTSIPQGSEEDPLLKEAAEELSRTIDFLQESVTKIRMTPLLDIFERFPRDVRNVAKDLQKQIQFIHTGGETEIDNTLLERLYEPLLHLIRNSIFHGIESEDIRTQQGKDACGTISVEAKHEEGWVVITIQDDGQGIDTEKVVEKAIAKGVLTQSKADEMKDYEKHQLIFSPGLSTVQTATNIAGRGVGMDIVLTEIEEMNGSVQIFSESGKGTKTILKLPLTLSIIQSLLAEINGEVFAFPISQVEEVIDIEPHQIKYAANKEIFFHRDQEIPILRLDHYFNLTSSPANKYLTLIVLKSGDRTVAVSVDQAKRNENIVVKSIGTYLGSVQGISGCTILGDGTICLIVDVNQLTKS